MRRSTRLFLILSVVVASLGAAMAVKLSARAPSTPHRLSGPDASLFIFGFSDLPVGAGPKGWTVAASDGADGKLCIGRPDHGPGERVPELWLDYGFKEATGVRGQVIVSCPPTPLPAGSRHLRSVFGGSGHAGEVALLVEDARGDLYEAAASDLSELGRWSLVLVGSVASLAATDLTSAKGMPQNGLTPLATPAAAVETETNSQSGLQAVPPAGLEERAAVPPAPTDTAAAPAPNHDEPAIAAAPGSPEEHVAATAPGRPEEPAAATTTASGSDASPAGSEPTPPSPPDAPSEPAPEPPPAGTPGADTSKLVLRGFVLRPTAGSDASGTLRLRYIEAVTGAALALEETKLALETPDGAGVVTRGELDQVQLRVQVGTMPVKGTLVCELRSFSGRRWRREQEVAIPPGRALATPLPTRPPDEGHYRYDVALHSPDSQGIFLSGTLAVVPPPTAAGRQRFGLGSLPTLSEEGTGTDLAMARITRLGAGWSVLYPDGSLPEWRDAAYWHGLAEEYLAQAPKHGLKLLAQAQAPFPANDADYGPRQLARTRRYRAALLGWWLPFAYSEGNGPNERFAQEVSAALGRRAILVPTFPLFRPGGADSVGYWGISYQNQAMGCQFPEPPWQGPGYTRSLDEFTRFKERLDRGPTQPPIWVMQNTEDGGHSTLSPSAAEAVDRPQACRLAIQMVRWAAVLRPQDRWHYASVGGDIAGGWLAGNIYLYQGPRPAAAAFATAVNLLAEARARKPQEFPADGWAQQFTTPRGPLTVCFQKDKYEPEGKPRQVAALVVSAPKGATLVSVVGEHRFLAVGTRHRLRLTEDLVYVWGEVTVTSPTAEGRLHAPTRPSPAAHEVHREPLRGQPSDDDLRRQDR